MSPELREQLRLSILRYLSAAQRATGRSLSGSMIGHYSQAEGFPADEVQPAIAYLMGKGLIGKEAKLISPEVVLYQITADGSDYLALATGA